MNHDDRCTKARENWANIPSAPRAPPPGETCGEVGEVGSGMQFQAAQPPAPLAEGGRRRQKGDRDRTTLRESMPSEGLLECRLLQAVGRGSTNPPRHPAVRMPGADDDAPRPGKRRKT